MLDQFPMKLRRLFLPFASRWFLAIATMIVGFVSHNFAAQNVQRPIEIRPGIHWQTERKDMLTILLPGTGEDLLKVLVGLVHRVNDEDLWNTKFGGVFPNPIRSHPDAMLRVNDDEGNISDAQSPKGFT